MEFYIDLLRVRGKSRLIFAFGIITIVFAFSIIGVRIYENQSLRLFDWLYSSVFLINGFIIIIQSLGYSPERIFGKAYIKIDNDAVTFKTTAFKKERKISWDDINRIIYKPNNFIFSGPGDELYELNLSNLAYKQVMEIKEFIRSMAEKRGLNIK